VSARRWVLASSNRGKILELTALFAAEGLGDIQAVPQSVLRAHPAEESAATFVENALLKARQAARATGLPAIADDSGLVVAALGGAPGVRSARYAGPQADDRANVAKLLAALKHVGQAERGAEFHCVLVALRAADDPAPIIASGRWPGLIARLPAGSGGFGYDPVFFDPVLGCTAAELDPVVKNRASHRGRAVRALAAALRTAD
jgi:XTP/dITP diphosphohydrolase